MFFEDEAIISRSDRPRGLDLNIATMERLGPVDTSAVYISQMVSYRRRLHQIRSLTWGRREYFTSRLLGGPSAAVSSRTLTRHCFHLWYAEKCLRFSLLTPFKIRDNNWLYIQTFNSSYSKSWNNEILNFTRYTNITKLLNNLFALQESIVLKVNVLDL